MFSNTVSQLVVRRLLAPEGNQTNAWFQDFAATPAGRLATAWCIVFQVGLSIVMSVSLPMLLPGWFTSARWWALPAIVVCVVVACHASASALYGWLAVRYRLRASR